MTRSPSILRFGPFEFDRDTSELRHEGAVVRLQPQPSQVLAILLSKPGRLVTRDELRDTVWHGRVIEFEGGINFAIRQVRKALGDSADLPQYVETVHGRGYRFIGIVAEPEMPGESGQTSRWPVRRTAVAAVVSLAVLAGAVAATLRRGSGEPTSPVRAIVAVLPFDAIGNDVDLSPFAAGLTEDLIADLALLGPDRLAVIAPASVRSVGIDPAADVLRSRLGADYAVRGTVRQAEDERRVTVRVERTADGIQVLTRRYDRNTGDDMTVQSDIARDVAAALSVRVLDGRRGAHGDIPPSVRDSLLAARWLVGRQHPGDMQRALDRLRWVREVQPEYAPAWALTAGALRSTGDRKGAAEAAARAVRLDSNLAEAQFQSAHAFRDAFRIADALAAFRRAIALAPGVARYRQWLAHYLANQLEFDEAIGHMELAKQLDPISAAVDFDLYMIYIAAHRWDDARTHCSTSADLVPRATWPKVCLFAAAYFDGQPDTAARLAGEIMKLEGADDEFLDAMDAYTPDEIASAYFQWNVVRVTAARDRGAWAPDYNFARAHGQRQNRDVTLHYLSKIATDRDPALQWALREVWFEFLHDDPRFRDILRDAGLVLP